MRPSLQYKYRNKHLEKIVYMCSICAREFDSSRIAFHVLSEFKTKKNVDNMFKTELSTMFDHGYKIDPTNYSEPIKIQKIIKLVRNNTKLKRTIKCDVCGKYSFKSMKEVNKHKKETHCY